MSGLRSSLLLLLCTVSTFIMKAYIAASCLGVVLWFVQHRFRHCRAYRSSCLFLSSGFDLKIFVTFTRYFPSRVLMTFSLSLVIVTCFAMSFALRSGAIARLILDASLLHCTRVAIPTILNFADQLFCWMRTSVFSFLFCCFQFFL